MLLIKVNQQLRQQSLKLSSIQEYCELLRAKWAPFRALFPHLVQLIQLLIVVPATSATAERSFSGLRPVKKWLRSTMSQTRLNNTVLLHAHRHLTPDISTVTNDFINLNDQRRRIFGAASSCVVVMQWQSICPTQLTWVCHQQATLFVVDWFTNKMLSS